MQISSVSGLAVVVSFPSTLYSAASFPNVAARNFKLASVCLLQQRQAAAVAAAAEPSLMQRRWHPCNAQPSEQEYVMYDEKKSVFPAEACEEVGGESCEVGGVGPEVKPKASTSKASLTSPLAGQDRDYVQYTGEKTVFPGEACEELGGEFCDPEYQKGVFPDKVSVK